MLTEYFSTMMMTPKSRPPWLHWLAEIPSTNSWSIEHSHELQHGDVVFTPKQTAGRGQFDRVWYSPAGVLTASFILDGLNPSKQSGLSLAVGLAVIYAIEDIATSCQQCLQLKWPNDVWYNQRKLAGILCEVTKDRVIVGIGCNLQVDFASTGLNNEISGNPISLYQIHPIAIANIDLIERLRHYLLETAGLLQHNGLEPLLPELQRRDGLRDKSIVLELTNQTIEGVGAGINSLGHLQILTINQQLQSFASGRVRLT
jgi:BirA family transcriptional regulator, biotin operon repressor / biotin---[acetyl-CoA-carboxylase] ligase